MYITGSKENACWQVRIRYAREALQDHWAWRPNSKSVRNIRTQNFSNQCLHKEIQSCLNCFGFFFPLCFCREMYVSFGGLLMLLRGDPAHISHFELDQRLFLLMRKLWDSFVWSFFGLDQDLSYVQLCFWCYAHESAIVPKQVLRTVSTSCIINYQLLQFKYALCSKFQKIIAWNHTSLDKNSRKQCYVLLLFWHTCKHLTKWIQKNSKCSVRLDQSKLSRPSRNVTLWPSEHLKESLLVLVSRSLATSPNQERLRRSIVTV